VPRDHACLSGRILLVTWDGGGNVTPALGLARRLRRSSPRPLSSSVDPRDR